MLGGFPARVDANCGKKFYVLESNHEIYRQNFAKHEQRTTNLQRILAKCI
jgi:5-methylcytosine-specific restriction endonuclease McrA